MTSNIKLLVESIKHCSHTDIAGVSILYIAQELLNYSTKLDAEILKLEEDSVRLHEEIEQLKTPELYASNLEKSLINIKTILHSKEANTYYKHIESHLLNSVNIELRRYYSAGSDTTKFEIKL